jgi:predicted SnoaL-like aldol condensation-catalyzing enzyme
MKTRFLVLLVLFASVSATSQEPVVGVADPESLFTDDDPKLHANKQVALHIMRELLQCNYWDEAANWLTERYIQHNPNVKSGLAPVVEFFTSFAERSETCVELTIPIVAVLADGDLVTVVWPREYPHPVNEGETYTSTWFDMWRIADGKADEHWDPATIRAPQ